MDVERTMDIKRTQEEYTRQLKITGIKVVHFLVSTILFYFFWLLFRYGSLRPGVVAGFRYNVFVTLGYCILLLSFNRTYNAYLLGYSRIRELASAEFLSQIFSTAILYVLVSLGWNHWNNPLWLMAMMAVQAVLNMLWAYNASGYYFRMYPPRKTILIYRNRLDKQRFGSIKGKPSERLYQITEELQWDGKFSQLREKLKGYEAVFVAGVNSRCRNGILKYCKEESIPGFFLPHIGDVIMQESMHIQSFDSPVLYVTRSSMRPEYRLIKRAFDIISSGLGLLILSPVMILTALAIRLYDGGPAIYKQTRLTRDGKEFQIWNVFGAVPSKDHCVVA